jgi:hypothetical protein
MTFKEIQETHIAILQAENEKRFLKAHRLRLDLLRRFAHLVAAGYDRPALLAEAVLKAVE